MSGIVHLIIGYIAIRLALGGAAGTADQSGAMTELAAKPGGIAALWVGVVAFAIMGLWRLAEAALGSSSRPDADSKKSEVIDRLKAFALAVVYFAFAFSAFGFARGSGKSSSEQSAGGHGPADADHRRYDRPRRGGALVIIAVGGYHVYKGASRSFLDDLEGTTGPLVRRLGMVGYIAKGLAIVSIGLLVILAVSRSEPDKAPGSTAPSRPSAHNPTEWPYSSRPASASSPTASTALPWPGTPRCSRAQLRAAVQNSSMPPCVAGLRRRGNGGARCDWCVRRYVWHRDAITFIDAMLRCRSDGGRRCCRRVGSRRNTT